MKFDVKPYCDSREAKDDKGKTIKVPYLNWAVCKKLLHENGAEKVFFEPCVNSNGSSLFMTDKVFIDKNGVANSCYEVRVKITIDDLIFEAQFPLMNGSNPVKDNSLTQQRLWNAQTRAFVKGVAMMTGLGFNLWIDEEHANEKEQRQEEDLTAHSIFAIQKRVQEAYSKVYKKGTTTGEIATKMDMTEDEIKYFFTLFDQIDRFEKKLNAL
ncbi:MAG: DUF1071 domain-containing protein [Clostridia bacterium]|nr:DUF1071 domain-containing protein [Clostridia bacterium]